MAYIPTAHKKYDILPRCRRSGGEVFSYDTDMEGEIGKIIPNGESVIPYGYDSYAEFDRLLDEYIMQYGMLSGKLNDVGMKILAYKEDIKRRNIKENWSVLKYKGKSTGGSGFTQGRYYYWPCSIDNPEYEGVIDDEEFTSYLASLGRRDAVYQSIDDALDDGGVKDFIQQYTDWEIAEDPTGMA